MNDYITWVAEGEPGYYRIVEYIQSIEKIVKWRDDILELGTHAPFISAYFKRKYDCYIVYSGVFNRINSPLYKFHYLDLCKDGIPGQWDIVTATEVLEHLPCNVYMVAEKLVNAVKRRGHLFVSAPVMGLGRGDRTLEETLEPPTDLDKEHLREFNSVDELKSLFPDLMIVDEWFSETRTLGQGNYCYNLLYQKI